MNPYISASKNPLYFSLFFREKVGIEETKEILVNYLRRKDRNLNRLLRYAELLKCGEVMKTYLKVLV